MDELTELQAIQDACAIIVDSRMSYAAGSGPVWTKMYHATNYLNERAAKLLRVMIGESNG